MFVIGSVAAKHWIPDFREPKDVDVWVMPGELNDWYAANRGNLTSFRPQKTPNKFTAKIKGRTFEVKLLTVDCPQYKIAQAQRNPPSTVVLGVSYQVPSLQTLILLKRSHLHYPLHWDKHIVDYHDMRKGPYHIYGSNVVHDTAALMSAYDELCKATDKYLGEKFKAHADLNMSNEDFFAKSERSVGRKFAHDDIHRAVMFGKQPMFERIKDDHSKAACSRALFDALFFEEKIQAVQEEAMVIALERKVIPILAHAKPLAEEEKTKPFQWALMRICTTLTTGWFRDFALEHWPRCSRLGFDYVEKFSTAELKAR